VQQVAGGFPLNGQRTLTVLRRKQKHNEQSAQNYAHEVPQILEGEGTRRCYLGANLRPYSVTCPNF
jgi:hypothetical protein